LVLPPRKLRPDIRAAFAAGGADEVRLDVGQPDMIGPTFGADGDVMAAMMIAAIARPRNGESMHEDSFILNPLGIPPIQIGREPLVDRI
jgi:hypothetical protein